MDLIKWSLNAIDTIFSTRSLGSREPTCPDGMFVAGYSLDALGSLCPLCLAPLSVEDIEDVYLFGLMITGVLLIGLGIALVYRQTGEMWAAVRGPFKLPDMINAMGKAVSTQTVMTNHVCGNIEEKLTALQRDVDRLGDLIEKLAKMDSE